MEIDGFQNIQLWQVSHGTEATETLPKDTPPALVSRIVLCQDISNGLAITDNAVCTEILEILSLLDCIPLAGKGSSCESRTEASASLVQKEHLGNRWASIYKQYHVKTTHLITLAEHEFHPGVRLRGTTSKARATLQIDQPRKLSLFGFLALFFSRLNRFVPATDTSCKEPQLVSTRLAVVHRDIEEQLRNPKFA